MVIFAASGWSILMNIVVITLSLLLMLLILIQRGKGGGLAGALGGMGGSSAFGSKSGDVLMTTTLYLAGIWVLCIMIHVKVAQIDGERSPPPPGAVSNQ